MAGLATTTHDALIELFAETILEVTPRTQSALGWSWYKRAANSATRMRRFRIVLIAGAHVPAGAHGNRNRETFASLAIRTDYAGDHADLMGAINDDWQQLLDVLSLLPENPANGLWRIDQAGESPGTVADSNHGRQRLSNSSPSASDTIQIDLTYSVRYNQARAA